MDAPSMAVATSSTFVAPTAAKPAPRIRLSASSLSGTSWKPQPSGTSPKLQFTRCMFSQSCTLNCTTVCRAPFTPKSSGTGAEKPERTGKKILSRFVQ